MILLVCIVHSPDLAILFLDALPVHCSPLTFFASCYGTMGENLSAFLKEGWSLWDKHLVETDIPKCGRY